MEWNSCPADPDRAVDAYLLGGLSPEEAVTFEEHYLSCPRCSERLQFTDNFILAFHRAAERLRRSATSAIRAA